MSIEIRPPEDNSSIYEKLASTPCSEEYIGSVIHLVDLKWIYQHQRLSLDFIFNYILDPEYHQCDEDSYITLDDVLYHQTHTEEEVENYIISRHKRGVR